ncbi:MAG: exodeoxyribonuclease VII small subunit [Chloroflexota bacterium]|nr:exodeoxyribonuclease VII small subunit [Chloroflexota bacterium]
MRQTEPTFEAIFEDLQETIGRLEQGGLPLQDAVAQFEHGMALAARCLEILDAAELRVTRVLESAAPVLDEPAF